MCRSSGQTRSAPAKPGPCWNGLNTGPRSIPTNFVRVCYSPDGKLADRTTAFLDRLKSAKIELSDTLLWVGCGRL